MTMKTNKAIIEEFLDFCRSEGISERRIHGKYRPILSRISNWLDVGFLKAEKTDIERVVRIINDKKDLSNWTKRDFKITIKKFYKWLEGDGEVCPKKARWIKTSKRNMNSIRPEDMLTQEEVKAMIDSAFEIRDKCIISLLYESGCRIGELMSLKIKCVRFGGDLSHIYVSGKTGDRPIAIVNSVPYLSTWMDNHPNKADINSPLFVSTRPRSLGKPLQYSYISNMLRDTAKKTGLSKKVNPHNFRHSRASHLATKFKLFELNKYFGWSKGSDMAGTYVHLSGSDIDDAVRELHGKTREAPGESEKPLAPRICPRCEKTNESTASYCLKCSLPLTEQARLQYENREAELLRSMSREDILEKMINDMVDRRVKEMGLG
jgi:site-specific recombinase XerD